ncbi:MAG: hypothetical protein A3I66_09305 [Burkholderiales bacterium RIFCSPLOWO2_02_FULL_57_36]|nr:MAG: hypothetical protein A3I66_09305 [Burkholderiales bacterium RIFCSPLOWO2_02_FULL_57_36]
MNRNQADGMVMCLLGKIQQAVGRFIGNQRQQTKGFQRQITGKAKIAIGDAQKIIKNCINRGHSF